jgi:hypothetical protein
VILRAAITIAFITVLNGPTDAADFAKVEFAEARRNATLSARALEQAHDLLVAWAGRKDSESSLLRSGAEGDRWTVATTAAELYTSLVAAAWLTDRPLYDGLLRETLRDEIALTSRLAALPDDYDLDRKQFVRTTTQSDRIIDASARYAIGLSRAVSHTGASPWSDRMRSLVDAAFLRANVVTDFAEGPLPSERAAVNGRYLRLLPLLSRESGDDGYLYYARRIGDAYCVGVLPKNGGLPADRWDFGSDRSRDAELTLDDGGVAIVEGLVSLYAAELADESSRADVYRPSISSMFDAMFSHGLTSGGHVSRRIDPDGRGGYSIDRRRASPHEARLLAAAARFGSLSGNAAYVTHAHRGADNLTTKDGAGSLLELAILADQLGSESFTARVWQAIERGIQTPPPPRIAEEDDADRLLWLTTLSVDSGAGTRLTPWRSDVRWGASVRSDTLRVVLQADNRWEGHLFFASPNSLSHPGYPRRYVIEPDALYLIRLSDSATLTTWQGRHLMDGFSVRLNTNQELSLTVVRQPPAPASLSDR